MLSKRADQLDANVVKIGNALGTIWANQRELTKSEALLDEQFAVLTRLSVISLNMIVVKHNLAMSMVAMAMGKDSVDELMLPEVEYDDINVLFAQWAEFRSRPDFREHMRTWFMGGDLNSLPPPPEPPEEMVAQQGQMVPKSQVKEGVEYVGDSGIVRGEGEEESSAGGPPDDVPEVR